MTRNPFGKSKPDEPVTKGEDAVMVLGLIVTSGFALAIATLLLVELLEALPAALSFVVFISVVATVVMIARAIAEKASSLPIGQRGAVPILRHLRR